MSNELFVEEGYNGAKYYDKDAVDALLAEKDAEIRRLKNSIAPKQSDKTLQERLNEVCEKHGVSTLQDLDWALCESEKRHTKDCIEWQKEIRRLKRAFYKACANWANHAQWEVFGLVENWEKWENVERKCIKKAEEYK